MFSEGQQIGPYTLVSKLGKGGFGEVWLAEKRSQFLTKRVAVKLPHDEQVNFDTIKREAMLWEEASGHPNVLPIIDADVYDGQVVIVSEYADGGSLADRENSVSATTTKTAVELTIGILSGLDYLHGKRIVHRDIKPQNILIQGGTPRLADFGISRAMQTTAVSSTIIGTDAYMSPEAFDGKRSVQTDVWSVGVVLYQLLNGTLPFPQDHPSERMFAVLTKDFAPLAPDIPADLRQIVERALQKLPENRYPSAAAMRDDLIKVLNRLNNPTHAKTEVLDRASLATEIAPTPLDTDATVVRRSDDREPEIPAHFADDSVVTRVEVSIPQEKVPSPRQFVQPSAGPIATFARNMSMGQIIVAAAGLLIMALLVGVKISGLSQGKTSGIDVNVRTPSNTATKRSSNSSNIDSNAEKAAYRSKGSSNSTSLSALCRQYIDGWNAGYDAVRETKDRVNVTCPDDETFSSDLDAYSDGYNKGRQIALASK